MFRTPSANRLVQRLGLFTKQLLLLSCILSMSGCSVFVSRAMSGLADSLSHAIATNDDPATVGAALPAYLVLLDGLIHEEPDSGPLLRASVRLHTAYASTFVEDNARAQKLTEKGLRYALRSASLRRPDACPLREGNFEDFEGFIASLGPKDVPTFYTVGAAWAAWIQAHSDDIDAIADIPRVKAIMRRVVELDERYQDGEVHLYLGTLATLLAPALGGKPELAREHFDRALEICQGRNLMVKVLYARQYARAIFNRELHDRLLKEVLESETPAPEHALVNALARQEAQELLDGADDFF